MNEKGQWITTDMEIKQNWRNAKQSKRYIYLFTCLYIWVYYPIK